jgi:hypothetical protein
MLLNLDKMDLKQKIFRNLGFIDQIFRILEYCSSEYLNCGVKYNRTVSGQHFSDEILFGKDNRPPRNAFLKNDLALKCIVLLIFSTIKNCENQQYLKEMIHNKQHTLFRLFFNSNSSLLKYFLTLLIKTYTENLTLLVKIPQNEIQLINSLVQYLHRNFSKDKSMSYYTFLSIFKFSMFKDLNIYQNQLFISDILRHNTMSNEGKDMIEFLQIELIERLEEYGEYGSSDISFPAHKFSSYLDDRDCQLMKIPDDIVFSTEFFRSIANLCRGTGKGKNRLITENRIYLSAASA